MADEFAQQRDLFLRALEYDGLESQLAFVAERCTKDHESRHELERMLKAHHNAEGFLVSHDECTHHHPQVTEKPGQMIGCYKLREQIGEGGFGVVYVAEQEQPLRRKVALKIVKPGMDSREVIARFEAERQALAQLDHPNIAKVLDAGSTDSGRPYFVMELIRGVPITEFCNQQQLPLRERLGVFIQVCRAIQHAHHKGIIHRDVKPSNVMVTLDDDRPVPKVIDFGVAKALSQKLTDKTVYTAYGQMVGTPLYMPPEQAQMSLHDVDTRSDVYSLGVLLYELLTGTTPFDKKTLHKSSLEEMRRIISEVEPQRPSIRINTLEVESLTTQSRQLGVDPRKLSQSLRRELDWIVMKTLEKDRQRRYESAGALAEDVDRYLNDLPIQAGRPSSWHRMKRAARRHRVLITSICIIIATLTLATVISVHYAIQAGQALAAETKSLNAERLAVAEVTQQRNRIQRAERASRRRAVVSQAVNDFIQNELLRQAHAHSTEINNVRLHNMLDLAATRFDKKPVDDPLIHAAIHTTIGNIYNSLDRFRASSKNHGASPHWDRAEQIRLRLSNSDREILDSMFPPLRPSQPLGMAIGPDIDGNGLGDLFVCSRTNEVLRFGLRNGKRLGIFIGRNAGGLDDPWGLVFGPNGDLYVASGDTHQILQYDGLTGSFERVLVDATNGGLRHPWHPWFGPDRNADKSPDLYVSSFDRENLEVRVFDGKTGKPLGPLFDPNSKLIARPSGMTLGPDGAIYICGAISNNVVRFDPRSERLSEFVSTESGGLNGPGEVSFGPDGSLYVAGGFTHAIHRFEGPAGKRPGKPLPSPGKSGSLFVSPRSGGLIRPRCMVFTSRGDLLVDCRFSNSIYTFQGPAGSKPGQIINTLISANSRAFPEATNVDSSQSPE